MGKRYTYTTTAPFYIVDTGQNMSAGFGSSLSGMRPAPPTPGRFSVVTDTASREQVQDIAVMFDSQAVRLPFAERHEALDIHHPGEQRLEIDELEQLRMKEIFAQSYSAACSALMAGQLTINGGSHDGTLVAPVSLLYRNSGAQISLPNGGSPTQQNIVVCDPPASFPRATTIEHHLPPSADHEILLDVPTRSVNGTPYRTARDSAYVIVWTGLVTVTCSGERTDRVIQPSGFTVKD